MIAKQDAYNKKYAATGELLGAYGVADAAAAKLVTPQGRASRPSPTAPTWRPRSTWRSFYLVDVESEERAYEIAAEMPWADQNPTEVWPILHEAADDSDVTASRSRTCCASSRRRSSARWRAATAGSTPARTPSRRRCSRPRCSGRPTGCRTIRAAGCSTVASRRLIDELRSEAARRRREEAVVRSDAAAGAACSRRRAVTGRGRHADAAVPVLPPVAVGAVADRADAARGRRSDDRARSPPRSSCPRRRWRSASAGPRRRSRAAGDGSSCRPTSERAERLRACCTCCT